MRHPKSKPLATLIEQMLNEASWLLSHAQALVDYGREEEAAAEWLRAAACEEQVACLLDAAGQEQEAALHRVSAASCYERTGELSRAANLYRAALAGPLSRPNRTDVERKLGGCLERLQKDMVGSVA